MKKTINFVLGVLTYFVISFIFFGFGHLTTHVQLNEIIATKFIDAASNDAGFADGKFKNYEFNWNNSDAPELTGPAFIGEAYISDPAEEDRTYMPFKWIAEGGWMEDEPWGPAALRHFYDPLGIDGGKKHLTDKATYLETILGLTGLPGWYLRDAKDWATSNDNLHGWQKAKYHMIQALKEDDIEQKERHMAKAYRYLGQSLHLIADMGCTPHVRNDSHPPDFTRTDWVRMEEVIVLQGDPDPFEDLCKILDARQYVSSNSPQSELVQKFKDAEKYEEIFEELAIYTNKTLPSNQTIRTTKYKQLIRPDNPYPSPSLTDADYDRSSFTYKVNNVKLCKDKVPNPSWFNRVYTGLDTVRGQPYIDFECVKSQAAHIMPNVAAAGVNVIRTFIPPLAIEISKATADSGGIIRGHVKYVVHSLNDEYSGLFDLTNIYNGDVTLYINNVENSVAASAEKNNFEIKLNGFMPNLSPNDKAKVSIEFGGIVLRSDEVNFSGEIPNISSISPTKFRPDDIITIYGKLFGNDISKGKVYFNSITATEITNWKDDQIKVKAPRGIEEGKLYISVDNKESNKVDFDLYIPKITIINPDSGEVGDIISITGENFWSQEADSKVMFNEIPSDNIQSWSSSTIQASVPPGATTGYVSVVCRGMESNDVEFNIEQTAKPTITGFFPPSALPEGFVYIYGTWSKDEHYPENSYVTLNGNELTIASSTSWATEFIRAKIPSSTGFGNAAIRVIYKGIESDPKDYLIGIPLELIKVLQAKYQYNFKVNIRRADQSIQEWSLFAHPVILPPADISWQGNKFTSSYSEENKPSTQISGEITPDGTRLFNIVLIRDYAGGHAELTMKPGTYINLDNSYSLNYGNRWINDNEFPPPEFDVRGQDLVDIFEVEGVVGINDETCEILEIIPETSNGYDSEFPFIFKK